MQVRADIQALRGYAVLLVLLYHSGVVPALQAGYLGVDVFFVVSGFLITSIIRRDLQAGSFSVLGFYGRRARRLLPAAYLTFVATAVAAPMLLSPEGLADFAWQLFGAVSFTANLVLWQQSGYFEGAAQLKPLLHVWSLSIEEQYYLLLPGLLMLVPRRWWWQTVLAITALSLCACLVLLSSKPGFVFYALPTRAWELGIGSLGAFIYRAQPESHWYRWLYPPALGLLGIVPFLPVGGPHPGYDALMVTVATLIVILRAPRAEGWLLRPLVRVGDCSYSLYLVHWPLYAYVANLYVSPAPAMVRAALLPLALVLAWWMYRYVETPFRHAAPGAPALPPRLLAASLPLACAGFALLHLHQPAVDSVSIGQPNYGLGITCEQGAEFVPDVRCRSGDHPRMLLWGDSFAMHLADALRAGERSFIQATRSSCAAFVPAADDASECAAFNRSVLAFLARSPEIQVVVLASVQSTHRLDQRLVPLPGQMERSGSPVFPDASLMTASAAAIRALGRRLVYVAPPPMSGFDIGRCLQAQDGQRPLRGADFPDCSIDAHRYRQYRASALAYSAAVAEAGIPVFHLDAALCDHDRCRTRLDGVALYRDGGHLSVAGSAALGRQLGLSDQVWTLAR